MLRHSTSSSRLRHVAAAHLIRVLTLLGCCEVAEERHSFLACMWAQSRVERSTVSGQRTSASCLIDLQLR